MQKRLKNKAFLAAAAGVLYQIVSKYTALDLGTYQMLVDVICYGAIGIGVYSSFDEEDKKSE